MKIVFIAGPFRGDGSKEAKLERVAVAQKFVSRFIEEEIPFYSPHLNLDQYLVNYGSEREAYAMSVNHEFLNRADALAVLPGWEESSGTKGEIEKATQKGIPIFYLEKDAVLSEIKNFINT